MLMNIVYTNASHPDFIKLTEELDQELTGMYGEMQKQYNGLNQAASVKEVVLIYMDEIPVACGAYKEYEELTIELKRIYVRTESRRKGIAEQIVQLLEAKAIEENYHISILETGVKQKSAVALYHKLGYQETLNYGPYIGDENSICMKKVLKG